MRIKMVVFKIRNEIASYWDEVSKELNNFQVYLTDYNEYERSLLVTAPNALNTKQILSLIVNRLVTKTGLDYDDIYSYLNDRVYIDGYEEDDPMNGSRVIWIYK